MAKDVDLFVQAMADVTPLPGHKRRRTRLPAVAVVKPAAAVEKPGRAPEKVSTPPTASVSQRDPRISAELRVTDQAFDRDIARALGRGRLVPQDAIDLHGMTVAAAERAVSAFLERAAARDLRIVLVVTGKGIRLEGGRTFGGRIRGEFLGWLDRADNRSRVRAVRPAHPRHGGGGAFYVLLRRRSSASSRSLRATPQR